MALRAIEFRLKLLGVIQDKRIAHHYSGCLDSQAHPVADLEHLEGNPDEELDPIRFQETGDGSDQVFNRSIIFRR